MALVAGVDGCKAGWVVVVAATNETAAVRDAYVLSAFAEVLERTAACVAVGVDMPIGLPDVVPAGGRACDAEARALLRPHGSRVFSAPARAVLGAKGYPDALARNVKHSESGTGLSKQAFAIVPKIREVDGCITPARQDRVFEVHPELSFAALNGGPPVAPTKRTAEGALVRMGLLSDAGLLHGLLEAPERVRGAGLDDVLDAAAAAWTAARYHGGAARRVPANPPVDGRGLRMEMWC